MSVRKRMVIVITGFLIFVCPASRGEENLSDKIEKPLNKSVRTRQETQKELDKWEKERLRLQATFDMLTQKNEALTMQHELLKKQEAAQKSLNESLVVRERECRRIAKEISPFVENLYQRLDEFIASDVPFLKKEREQRMSRLRTVLDDMEVDVSEKFRKVMEALFVEAEYGATIEVYQDKITLAQEEMTGDIFRLGRISLFFLSLDHETAAYFNVAEKKWAALDNRYVPTVHAAVEMGAKRRPMELLCLPVGKLADNEE